MGALFFHKNRKEHGYVKYRAGSWGENEERILWAKEILLSELEKGRSSGETEGWLRTKCSGSWRTTNNKRRRTGLLRLLFIDMLLNMPQGNGLQNGNAVGFQ